MRRALIVNLRVSRRAGLPVQLSGQNSVRHSNNVRKQRRTSALHKTLHRVSQTVLKSALRPVLMADQMVGQIRLRLARTNPRSAQMMTADHKQVVPMISAAIEAPTMIVVSGVRTIAGLIVD